MGNSGEMKEKIVVLIDAVCIIITTFYLWYINNRESYGMEALGDLGRFVLALGFLGIEFLILTIVCIIIIYKKLHKR